MDTQDTQPGSRPSLSLRRKRIKMDPMLTGSHLGNHQRDKHLPLLTSEGNGDTGVGVKMEAPTPRVGIEMEAHVSAGRMAKKEPQPCYKDEEDQRRGK